MRALKETITKQLTEKMVKSSAKRLDVGKLQMHTNEKHFIATIILNNNSASSKKVAVALQSGPRYFLTFDTHAEFDEFMAPLSVGQWVRYQAEKINGEVVVSMDVVDGPAPAPTAGVESAAITAPNTGINNFVPVTATRVGGARVARASRAAPVPRATRPARATRRAPTPAVEEQAEVNAAPKTGPASRTRSRSAALRSQGPVADAPAAAPAAAVPAPQDAPAPANIISPAIMRHPEVAQRWVAALADATALADLPAAAAAAAPPGDENEDPNAGADGLFAIANALEELDRADSIATSTPDAEAPVPRSATRRRPNRPPARRNDPFKGWAKVDHALFDTLVNVDGVSEEEAVALVKTARSDRHAAGRKRSREEAEAQLEDNGRSKRTRKPSSKALAFAFAEEFEGEEGEDGEEQELVYPDPPMQFAVGVAPRAANAHRVRNRKRLSAHVVPSATDCELPRLAPLAPAAGPAAAAAAANRRADAINAAMFRAAGARERTTRKKTKGAAGGVKKPKAKKPAKKPAPAAPAATRSLEAYEADTDMEVDMDLD